MMHRRLLAAGPSRALAPRAASVALTRGAIAQPHRSDALTEGERLTPALREGFESRFGHDFGRVRVHRDADAAAAAKAQRAAAYTIGEEIYFGAGRYRPDTPDGRQLVAHELAHSVQQARGDSAGLPRDAELRADRAAREVVQGRTVSPRALGGAPPGLQAKPEDAPPIPSLLPSLDLPLVSVDLAAGESTGKDNPKLVQIAESYKANAGLGSAVRVRLSADLPEGVKYDSAKESAERRKLGARMRAMRDALQALGVPADAIDISPATAYSTSARGQVSAEVSKPAPLPSLLLPLQAPGATPLAGAPPVAAPGPSLPSLDLDLKFGPVTVSLPKEVRAKLPIPLRGGKQLVIDLAYEVPAKFSFKMTLDGTPHVRLSIKAGTEIDAKNAAITGSSGLQIETVASVCNAPDPGETREKIKSAGDKLNKAAKEYESATGSDKLGKAFDIASAIGEMYDAVDKAKAKCKSTPRATIELGYKRLLSPGSETDPMKLPPLDYAGVTATFHF